MEHADRLMKEAIAGDVFPGGCLLVSKENRIVFFKSYGRSNIFSGRSMTLDTIFDLASLTKPLATTLAVMILVQEGKLDLDQELVSILPQFRNTGKEKITIQNLLFHNSGFPDYKPYYETLKTMPSTERKNVLRRFLLEEPLIHPVGTETVYSDLGFMVLCWIIETITEKHLDCFVKEDIYRPLGIENLYFLPIDSQLPSGQFAATEQCPWRHVLLEGAVHDDNAYVVGGVEGHSGLFGTAGDVHALLSVLMSVYHGTVEKNSLFKEALVRAFFQRLGKAGRAMGFDTPSRPDSSCGDNFSKRTVGHLGFTGTSFWMDLDRSIIVILLTNRVHPSRDNVKIRAFRPELHNSVMKSIINTG